MKSVQAPLYSLKRVVTRCALSSTSTTVPSLAGSIVYRAQSNSRYGPPIPAYGAGAGRSGASPIVNANVRSGSQAVTISRKVSPFS